MRGQPRAGARAGRQAERQSVNHMNDSALALLGGAREQWLMQPLPLVLRRLGGREEPGRYAAVLETGEPFVGKVPIEDMDEHEGLVGGVSLEITDLKRAQAERAELLRRLEQAVQFRDEFLAVASHELKTPLTTLQLQIDGLLRAIARSGGEALTAERLARLAEGQSRQLHRLTLLINDLLDISRIHIWKAQQRLTAPLAASPGRSGAQSPGWTPCITRADERRRWMDRWGGAAPLHVPTTRNGAATCTGDEERRRCARRRR